MGVDVRVGGVPEWNASGISVEEDSTPLDPADSFGGVGAAQFTIPEGARAKSLLNTAVEVESSERGVTAGVVKAVSGDRHWVKVAALSRLSALVADRTALPHVGTIESCLTYYFGLCDITSGFTIDPAIADVEVVAPGWFGSVWEQLKKFCAAYQIEVSLVDGEIVARAPRSQTVALTRDASFSWALDESGLAQTVEAWYYPVEPITDALVVGNNISPVSNIDAGEVVEFTVPLEASLSSVEQPVAVDSVAFSESSASVYSVLDQYDEPVSAAAWTAGGGRVSVEISEDTRSLHVTVVGSQNRFLAPYRIAGFAISGDQYSTLRIIGSGVSMRREKYTLPACTDSRAAEIVGAEVDNDFLGSWGYAHLVLLHSVRRHGVAVQRIKGTANLPGSFGNVAGARVFEDHNAYRIRSVKVGDLTVGYDAEADVTFGDVDGVNSGFTIEEWDAMWAGRPISEFDLRPLSPIEGEVTPPTGGFGSGVFGGPPVFGG